MITKHDIYTELTKAHVQDRLRSHQIQHIWLAGSFNDAKNKRGSDIDLIYSKDSSVGFDNRGILGAQSYLKNKFRRNIDLIHKDLIHPTINQDILYNATPIW